MTAVPGVEAAVVFQPPLVQGTLLRRYKRFLADVKLDSGEEVLALCQNTGTMKSCAEPGRPVALSFVADGKRRCPYLWQMIKMDGGWVGVNTQLPNLLVERALKLGLIPELMAPAEIQREAACGPDTRIDFLLEGPAGRTWVEVKNVSLAEGEYLAFPDAVTKRGLKHLETLESRVRRGDRAVMLFLVQRPDGKEFRPADHIDPAYGDALRRVAETGVEVLVYRAEVGPDRIRWGAAVAKNLDVFKPKG